MKHLICLLALLCLLPMTARAVSVTEERAAIQKERDETLAKLYDMNPDARREIADAPGYAVFSSGSLAFIYISGGYGHGMAHNNRTNHDSYMNMATGGIGLGLGVKNYRIVFVFHDAQAFTDFVTTGLDLSGSADAAIKNDRAKGGAFTGGADVLENVRVYQITDKGVLVQAMLQGTKYWQDNSLNGPDHPYDTNAAHSSYGDINE